MGPILTLTHTLTAHPFLQLGLFQDCFVVLGKWFRGQVSRQRPQEPFLMVGTAAGRFLQYR